MTKTCRFLWNENDFPYFDVRYHNWQVSGINIEEMGMHLPSVFNHGQIICCLQQRACYWRCQIEIKIVTCNWTSSVCTRWRVTALTDSTS
jgi:hypothetical protein